MNEEPSESQRSNRAVERAMTVNGPAFRRCKRRTRRSSATTDGNSCCRQWPSPSLCYQYTQRDTVRTSAIAAADSARVLSSSTVVLPHEAVAARARNGLEEAQKAQTREARR